MHRALHPIHPLYPRPKTSSLAINEKHKNVDTHYFYTFLSISGRGGDLGLRKRVVIIG